jgi:hypothetical protein
MNESYFGKFQSHGSLVFFAYGSLPHCTIPQHGVRRTAKPTAEIIAERKEKELAKIKSYTTLSDRVLAKVRIHPHSIPSFPCSISTPIETSWGPQYRGFESDNGPPGDKPGILHDLELPSPYLS